MSVAIDWLLCGWYRRELRVHQQSYRPSVSNQNVDTVPFCEITFMRYVQRQNWYQQYRIRNKMIQATMFCIAGIGGLVVNVVDFWPLT